MLMEYRRGRIDSDLGGRGLAPHPGRHRDSDQQSLGAEQARHDLSPRLGALAHEELVAALLELCSRGFVVIDVQLEPRVRGWWVGGPFSGASACLRGPGARAHR